MNEDATIINPAQDSSAAPVSQTERIESIDVLRGFALLGILVMNIQAFAMPQAAYFNPTAYGDLTGVNRYVWIAGRLLADQKFMTIFSLLYGAGIVLMTARAGTRSDARRVHYRRMRWLLVIGLLHGHLLWWGDILFHYAVCGMLVYPLRRQSPRRLLVLGVVLLVAFSAFWGVFGLSFPYWPEEARAKFVADAWQPPQEKVDAELATYRGGWLEQMPDRSVTALASETLVLVMWAVWRAGGLMLIGMALFKKDVFNARRSTRFYVSLIAVAAAVGIPLQAYGISLDFATGWSFRSFFVGFQLVYWTSIAVGLGYVGAIMLVCRTPALRRFTRPFAAVGQTALTNYLLQTVICTSIFYGHGLGWFGSVDRIGQAGVMTGVWAVQLIASPLWLRRYRFGPVEWAWRSLTYRARQPMRRSPVPEHAK
ncbi:MAG: DUF418 domain-containing protein [Gemmatimonadetes bacterium]|nr:DUF418 domain-containing protein [Gemmatimonadota bacterium]MDE3259249.1 DUF418 domain-containing protein [Gemmatimonadota bacterium]